MGYIWHRSHSEARYADLERGELAAPLADIDQGVRLGDVRHPIPPRRSGSDERRRQTEVELPHQPAPVIGMPLSEQKVANQQGNTQVANSGVSDLAGSEIDNRTSLPDCEALRKNREKLILKQEKNS